MGRRDLAAEYPGLEGRFWAKVQKLPAGCWIWTAAQDGKGYGQIGLGGRRDGHASAHRVSWELANGEIPDGLCVLHSCDTPLCVRPSHLFLGTKLDNSRDMRAKGRHFAAVHPGRQARGERAGGAKLTAAAVSAMRAAYEQGATQVILARQFGVHQTNVSMIVRRKTWGHV